MRTPRATKRRLSPVGFLIATVSAFGAGCRSDNPAPALTQAAPTVRAEDSSLTLKRGVLRIEQAGMAFTPCGETVSLRVIDQSDGALAEHFPPTPAPMSLYVEAYGERSAAETADGASSGGSVFILEQTLYAAPSEQVRGCSDERGAYVALARGNEPFWAAEVQDAQLIWRQPDAPQEVVMDAPQSENIEGAVQYRAAVEAHTLELVIETLACRDGMSGEFFAYTARAVFDGRAFSGCARLGR